MEQELIRYAKLRGLHRVIEALIRLKSICFPVWLLHTPERIVSSYRIIVDGDYYHFATPEELLRKLDELGVFDIE